jgi:hypothetical protein
MGKFESANAERERDLYKTKISAFGFDAFKVFYTVRAFS